MKKLLSNRILAMALGGLVVGLSVFAFQASASSIVPNTVTICVKNSGFVYVVGQGFWTKDCGKRDQLITINTAGVPGPKGDTGAQGPKGDPGDSTQLNQTISNLEQRVQELSDKLSCLSKVGNDLYFDNCNITVRNGTIQTIPPEVTPPPAPVEQATLTIAKYSAFGDQNVAPNTVNQKIGSFVLTAGNTEPIRVSNIKIQLSSSTLNYLVDTSDLNIMIDGNRSIAVSAQSSNNFPVDLTLQPNQSKIVDVYLTVGNVAASDLGFQLITRLSVSARGAITASSVSASEAVNGQIITVVAGS